MGPLSQLLAATTPETGNIFHKVLCFGFFVLNVLPFILMKEPHVLLLWERVKKEVSNTVFHSIFHNLGYFSHLLSS